MRFCYILIRTILHHPCLKKEFRDFLIFIFLEYSIDWILNSSKRLPARARNIS